MSQKPRLHWAIPVAFATFLALLGASAFRSTTSVLYMPFEMEFGWSRASTSLALSVNLVFYGLMAPFAATLMARFSVRSIGTAALALVAIGTGLTTLMTEVWQLVLLWGVVVGIATGAMALVGGALVATRWFVKGRGLVTGIFSAAYATGSLIFLPLISNLVEQHGWRTATLVISTIAGFTCLVFVLLFRESPASVGQLPFGATEPIKSSTKAPVTLRGNFRALFEAAKTFKFWALASTFFVCGWTTNGLIGAHFIPAAHDHGMPATLAAGLLAVVGIFDIIGTVASGWLTDRVNPVILLAFYYGLRGLALFTVPFVLGPTVEPPLLFFIVFYGLDWVATVPPTIELCRRYFGVEVSPMIFGWLFASHMIGASIAAEFAGAIRVIDGSYFIAWITAAVLCILATGTILLLLRGRVSKQAVA
ncbi:MAG: MFS transporter [Micrococcales bacterium]